MGKKIYALFNEDNIEIKADMTEKDALKSLVEYLRENNDIVLDAYVKRKLKRRTPAQIAVSKKDIKADAWYWFSKYIRLKNADENGYVKCVTCVKILFWKDGDAGHYIDSRNNSVLFHEKIVHFQCKQCNIKLSGNKNKYTEFMKEQGYSDQDLMLFENLKHQVSRIGRKELEWIRDSYKEKAMNEASKRGLEI